MSILAKIVTALMVLAAGSGHALADTYRYHPRLTLALGRGVSPNDLFAPKEGCIDFVPMRLDPGPPLTTFSQTYVTSDRSLYESIGYELRAEAAYLDASANAGIKATSARTTDAHSVRVVVTATTDFGRWGLKAGASLTEDAKRRVADPAGFAKFCGTEFVSIERRGASVAAVLTVNTRTDALKRAFELSLGGSASYGPISASLQQQFNSELKKSAREGRLTVDIVSTGGIGLGGLNSVVIAEAATDAGLDAVKKSLAEYLKSFSESNAAAVEYVTASMEQFGWDRSGYVEEPLDYQRLIAISEEFKRASARLALIEEIERSGSRLRPLIGDGNAKLISSYMKPTLRRYLDRLRDAHEACKRDREDDWCTSMFDDDGAKIFNPPDLPIFDKLFHAPAVRFEAEGDYANPRTDEQRLSADAVRVILDTPVGGRAAARKPIDAYPGPLNVTVKVVADYPLKTVRTIFQDSESAEETVVVAENVIQGPDVTCKYYSTDPDGTEFSFESDLMTWTKQSREKRSGVFLFLVKDAADREWRVPFLEATWSKGGRDFQSRVLD
jgi:hypothetical protein